MKELETNYIIIKSSDLVEGKPYDVAIIISQKKEYNIKGIVYDEDLRPLPHASIEIMEIDKISGASKVIGNIFSNDSGEYVFAVSPTFNLKYKITAYSPLVRNSKSDTI